MPEPTVASRDTIKKLLGPSKRTGKKKITRKPARKASAKKKTTRKPARKTAKKR